MKIAVYTIAKNEEQFVERWANSCKDADYRLILDTGSTDKTVEIASSAGVLAYQHLFVPWRFDNARNYALDLVPDDTDFCIALDMDEVLVDGWRETLEAFLANHPTVTRPRYKYVWSWGDDGSEGLVYGGDKIHARHGYIWKHPVHEVITPTTSETQGWVDGLCIHHYPDNSKSRSQYFDLLKLAVSEEPDDDRNQFYLGREYFFHGMNDLALEHLGLAVRLSRWNPERAAAFRMMYACSGDVRFLFDALMADPTRRENLVALARYYYGVADWAACFQFAVAATNIKVKPLDYLCESEAWGWLPYDLAAISAWNLNRFDDAVVYGRMAVDMCPDNTRLIKNLEFYDNGFAVSC